VVLWAGKYLWRENIKGFQFFIQTHLA
jgi:hypothetical protein